jgi:hypothetical protein
MPAPRHASDDVDDTESPRPNDALDDLTNDDQRQAVDEDVQEATVQEARGHEPPPLARTHQLGDVRAQAADLDDVAFVDQRAEEHLRGKPHQERAQDDVGDRRSQCQDAAYQLFTTRHHVEDVSAIR